MKNLKVDIQIHISEHEAGEHDAFDKTLITLSNHRQITSTDGLLYGKNEKRIRYIIEREINNGVDMLRKSLAKISYPLGVDSDTFLKKIKAGLEKLYPNLDFGVTCDNGKVCIYKIYVKGGDIEGVPISHPKAPNQILTHVYKDVFEKLNDGTWTYQYQGSDYYKEVVEIIPAPVDEKIIGNYFKDLGVEWEIGSSPWRPMPEPESLPEPEED